MKVYSRERRWAMYNEQGKYVGLLVETKSRGKIILINNKVFNWSPKGFRGTLNYGQLKDIE
jgi:hypothetical protein